MNGNKKDKFLMVGISHKTAPVEIREKFSFNKENISRLLADIHAISGISECVVVSTCNRTEIYAIINKPAEKVREKINHCILEISGEEKDFLEYFDCLHGEQVIEHLFNVTCGLNSMILGEPQIFGQVKKAYAFACDNKCTGPALNRLFHHAFQVGKRVRNNTSIGKGIVSISSAAVMLAKKTFGNLEERIVLLVGTGKIGKLCAKQFIDSGIKRLYITNRTTEHAVMLAEEISGEVIPFDKIEEMYKKADIIVTSVTSPEPLITKSRLLEYLEQRNGKPLSLIDLGVPRNIDPETAEIENIHLFNIDALEDVTFGSSDMRKNEIDKVQEIIREEIVKFYNWLKMREVIPVINNLRKKCENIRLEELVKIKNKTNSETYETVDFVTRRIVRKILHNPTISVKDSASYDSRQRLLESIKELFIRE